MFRTREKKESKTIIKKQFNVKVIVSAVVAGANQCFTIDSPLKESDALRLSKCCYLSNKGFIEVSKNYYLPLSSITSIRFEESVEYVEEQQ